MRTFCAPHLYVQGPGVTSRLGGLVAGLGSRAVLVVDAGVRLSMETALLASCQEVGLDAVILEVSGQVTRNAIDCAAARVEPGESDVVVGVGGGKALDLAKGIAATLGTPMVTVPTIASNDGATARVFALYDDHDVICELGMLPVNPDVVLVDTEVIAHAPVEFLLSGIGDALAKRFEARACALGTGVTTQGTRPLLVGEAVATACYDVLLANAAMAVKAVGVQAVTPELEATVEAVVLLSGLGYENGGLSVAHCMTRGLMAGRGSRHALHGYHVGYGLLVQLCLEGSPQAQVDEVRDFLQSVELPVSLAGLGMTDPSSEEILALADAARSAPHIRNSSADTSVSGFVAAIRHVEEESGSIDDAP